MGISEQEIIKKTVKVDEEKERRTINCSFYNAQVNVIFIYKTKTVPRTKTFELLNTPEKNASSFI